jgi:hypothetical protein
LAYVAFLREDWDTLFNLTFQAKNLELLALEALGYVRINREDLAQKTVGRMNSTDSDHPLTALAEAFVSQNSVGTISAALSKLQETGERSEWTLRLYELKAIAHARAGDGKAADVFKQGWEQFKPAGEPTEEHRRFARNYLRVTGDYSHEMKGIAGPIAEDFDALFEAALT